VRGIETAYALVVQVGEEKKRRGPRGGCQGCGGGCAGVIFVLTVGLILTLLNVAVGIGVSVRVPFTGSNVTLAGAVGKKEKVDGALPGYVQQRLADNHNFFNQTNTLTIWVAEGAGLVVIGHQDGAPAVDLHLEAK
jgi:hypothetical protein